MNNNLIHPVQDPAKYMPSIYSNTPEMLARELPDMVSVNMRELFPMMPEPIYSSDRDDVSVIAEKTREALMNVDMSNITPETSVNMIASEHGFCICGGKPYIQMLKTIREVVIERTGCIDFRLKVVMWRTPKEGTEAIDFYNLREEFDNNVDFAWAYDKGVAIETRIGTLYGLEKCYDADRLILAYYDDPREVYAHNIYRKSFKAFTMNMARYETRGTYHLAVGMHDTTKGNTSAIVPTAIYDSEFVQKQWAFGCFLTSSPTGIDGVYADNDLYKIDDHDTEHVLRYYPMMYELYRDLEHVSVIIEGGRWFYYIHGGGIIAGFMTMAALNNVDRVDLDVNSYKGETVEGGVKEPNVKNIIINQCWYGIGSGTAFKVPTILVGEELGDNMLMKDTLAKSLSIQPFHKVVDTLPDAVRLAKENDPDAAFMIFDGSFGFLNCSRDLAEQMITKAPAVADRVRNKLYPKYMKQRGLEPQNY